MAYLSPASSAAIARLRSYVAPPTTWYSLPLSRRAAVLILLFADKQGDLRVVLTMRAATLKSYAGQAALPGGKSDTLEETPVDTARREAAEEIGLPKPRHVPATEESKRKNPPSTMMNPSISELKNTPDTPDLPYPFRIEHLCQLPTNLAKTELGVRPIVALLYATSPVDRHNNPVSVDATLIPRLDAKEVAAVFSAPFHNFLRADDDVPEDRKVPGFWYKGSWTDWHESKFRMHNFYVPVVGQNVTKPRGPANPAYQQKDRQGDDTALQRSTSQPSATQSAGDQVAHPPPSATLPYRDHPGPDSLASPLDSPRYRVFGMTARILVDCARVAYGEDPKFEHNSHFGDEAIVARLVEVGRLQGERSGGEEFVGGDVKTSLGSGWLKSRNGRL